MPSVAADVEPCDTGCPPSGVITTGEGDESSSSSFSFSSSVCVIDFEDEDEDDDENEEEHSFKHSLTRLESPPRHRCGQGSSTER